MFLVLGPIGSGKTLLLKRLNSLSSRSSINVNEELPPTISTVGVNILTIHLDKKREATAKELGGAMSPLWYKYLTKEIPILFVIDMSNKYQLASAYIQLLELLGDLKIQNSKFLIILNKIDVSECMTQIELESIIPLSELTCCATQDVKILSVSAATGRGLSSVLSWLQNNISDCDSLI